jgi:transposase
LILRLKAQQFQRGDWDRKLNNREDGMRAYSTDLRERIVRAYENGEGTQRELAERFDVSLRCVQMLLRRWREEKTVEPKPHGGGQPAKVSPEQEKQLKLALQEQPDATLEELRQRCGINASITSVFRALRRLDITRKKKTLQAAEQLEDEIDRERQEWLADVEGVAPGRLIFLDQSNAKTDMTRRYGRAPRGERVLGYVPDGRYESMTMLSALDYEGTTHCVVYEGGTDVPVMRTIVEECLAPALSPRDIVSMDNLAAHHNPEVVAAIEATGAEVWFLPRYSPDMNPVEPMWSKVTAYLQKAAARTKQDLLDAIGKALDTITPTDAKNWYQHCGYAQTHS